jgi:hypothetical protein
MKRWGAILGLGLVIILAALMVLRPFQRAAKLPSNAALYVRPDGSVELNGKRFADMALLQAALVDACAQKPKPMFYLRAAKPIDMDRAKVLFDVGRRAGCLGYGQLQPYTVPEPR